MFGLQTHYFAGAKMIFLLFIILFFIFTLSADSDAIIYADGDVIQCDIYIQPPPPPRQPGQTPKFVPYEDPPVVLVGEQPAYPEALLKMKIFGEVILHIEVFEDGSVGAIEVMKSLMQGTGGFDEAAINAVKQWKFQPAKSGGYPVACWIGQLFRFTPPDDMYEPNYESPRPPTQSEREMKMSYTGEAPVLLSGGTPAYPKHLLKTNKSGQVVLDIEVKDDGTIGAVDVVKSLMTGPDGFDEIAVNAVKQWKMYPATDSHNRPVACNIRQTFNFTSPIKGLEE